MLICYKMYWISSEIYRQNDVQLVETRWKNSSIVTQTIVTAVQTRNSCLKKGGDDAYEKGILYIKENANKSLYHLRRGYYEKPWLSYKQMS